VVATCKGSLIPCMNTGDDRVCHYTGRRREEILARANRSSTHPAASTTGHLRTVSGEIVTLIPDTGGRRLSRRLLRVQSANVATHRNQREVTGRVLLGRLCA
jgi:hypothetical protein